ncbi:MAG: phage tail protein [Anaeromicrobium sp.]|uniref:phage tail protein n=1 Tax=Anaeromicrobium sp. TaxID=1929132 RepID=UPI0025FB9ADC|nr:phage tail protein [Anaeromicrobium sp.]MCT4593111.1 phage tail protein [Anaeromicrobium sp.]
MDKKNMPVGSFSFAIEIEGIQEASFMKVSAIAQEVEVETYEEGGMNHFVHQLPVRTKYSNVVLERGMTNSTELMNWFNQIKEGIIIKKNFSIILYDQRGNSVRRWDFFGGYPVKWEASDLDAMSSNMMIEKIEITHEGMRENN